MTPFAVDEQWTEEEKAAYPECAKWFSHPKRERDMLAHLLRCIKHMAPAHIESMLQVMVSMDSHWGSLALLRSQDFILWFVSLRRARGPEVKYREDARLLAQYYNVNLDVMDDEKKVILGQLDAPNRGG